MASQFAIVTIFCIFVAGIESFVVKDLGSVPDTTIVKDSEAVKSLEAPVEIIEYGDVNEYLPIEFSPKLQNREGIRVILCAKGYVRIGPVCIDENNIETNNS
jgi:hypothetical protein